MFHKMILIKRKGTDLYLVEIARHRVFIKPLAVLFKLS